MKALFGIFTICMLQGSVGMNPSGFEIILDIKDSVYVDGQLYANQQISFCQPDGKRTLTLQRKGADEKMVLDLYWNPHTAYAFIAQDDKNISVFRAQDPVRYVIVPYFCFSYCDSFGRPMQRIRFKSEFVNRNHDDVIIRDYYNSDSEELK